MTKKISNTRVVTAVKAAAAALALAAAGSASAQTAGTWMFRVANNQIMPKVSSGNLTPSRIPNAKIDVDSASAVIVTAGYMYTDNISVELFLGSPYRHDLKGAGSIGAAGKIGSVQQMPPTLLFQYRFLDPKSVFRPYVGLGATYIMFRDEQGSARLDYLTQHRNTTLSVDNAWAPTVELGGTVSLSDRWFVSSSVHKTFVRTTARLSTGQTLDARLDPVSVNFGIGYRY